jgi:hypothetical protein
MPCVRYRPAKTLSNIAAAFCACALLAAVSPAGATPSPTPFDVTQVTQPTSVIDVPEFDGQAWYEFAWTGGALTISGTVTATGFTLWLETASHTGAGSDAFTGDSSPYTAQLVEADLAAVDYYVGIYSAPDPTGTLTFSSPVDPVPQPASLGLLGTALRRVGEAAASAPRRIARTQPGRGCRPFVLRPDVTPRPGIVAGCSG